MKRRILICALLSALLLLGAACRSGDDNPAPESPNVTPTALPGGEDASWEPFEPVTPMVPVPTGEGFTFPELTGYEKTEQSIFVSYASTDEEHNKVAVLVIYRDATPEELLSFTKDNPDGFILKTLTEEIPSLKEEDIRAVKLLGRSCFTASGLIADGNEPALLKKLLLIPSDTKFLQLVFVSDAEDEALLDAVYEELTDGLLLE